MRRADPEKGNNSKAIASRPKIIGINYLYSVYSKVTAFCGTVVLAGRQTAKVYKTLAYQICLYTKGARAKIPWLKKSKVESTVNIQNFYGRILEESQNV